MFRSQSQQDMGSLNYQNICSRINRLRSSHNVFSPIPKSPNITVTNVLGSHSPKASRPSSCYRQNLRVQQNGVFGLDISNHIGRVARNTGIRKYNQRQIKQALTRDSIRLQDSPVNKHILEMYEMQKSTNLIKGCSPRYRNSPEQISRSIDEQQKMPNYDFIHVASQSKRLKVPQQKGLEPGKIYTVEKLSLLL